jgi:hypothetical protein
MEGKSGWLAAACAVLWTGCSGFPINFAGQNAARDTRRIIAPQNALTEPIHEYVETSLEEILRDPEHFRGQEVSLRVLFNRWGEAIQVPYFTPFTSDSHMSFSAWAPDARIWTEEGRMALHPLFFIARNHFYLGGYDRIPQYSICQIRGRVASTYGGLPWIDVNELQASPYAVYSRESLRALMLGLEQAQAGVPAAEQTIRNALAAHRYPEPAERELRTALARFLVAAGRYDDAASEYRRLLAQKDEPVLRLEYENVQREIRRRGVTERLGTPPPPPDGGGNGGAAPEREQHQGGGQGRAPAREDGAALLEETARLRAEVARLREALAEAQQAAAGNADLERDRAALAAEVDRLRAELAHARAAAARNEDAPARNTTEAERERNALRAELTRVRQEAAAERDRLRAEIERLRAAIAAYDPTRALVPALQARESLIQALSLRDAGAPAEPATAPVSRGAADARIAELEEENRRLALALHTERARIEAELDRQRERSGDSGAAERIRELEELVRRLRDEVARLTRERDDLMRNRPPACRQ